MDDRQETSLIEIMVCCVKQAATGEYPVGRGPNRKVGADKWPDTFNVLHTKICSMISNIKISYR